MKKLFSKKQVMTIPNLLSLIRLIMIPFIVWFYVKTNYYAATALVVLSGITDVVDGIIARKFNMVSDLGKILDPIADKCTQGIVIICLSLKYRHMMWLVMLFVVKECIMGLLGYITIKSKDSVNSAKWYGKVSTLVLYASMISLIIFSEMPAVAVDTIIALCSVFLILSLVMYVRFYIKILSEHDE